MSKKITRRRKDKPSRDLAKYVEVLRLAAKRLLMSEDDIGLPENRVEILEILECFIELTRPPPDGPMEIAELIDANVAYYVEREGELLEQAVVKARKSVAEATKKSFQAVKSAHLRYGNPDVAKS